MREESPSNCMKAIRFASETDGSMEECSNCRGTGYLKDSKECPRCKGLGVKRIIDDYGQKRVIRCFNCRGTGKIKGEVACPKCQGTGKG